MKKLVFLSLALVVFSSCNKWKYRDAQWLTTDHLFGVSATGETYVDSLMNFEQTLWDEGKVMQLTTAEEFQAFVAYVPTADIGGNTLPDSPLGDVDFEEETVYVLGVKYGSQCDPSCGKVTRSQVRISDVNDKICFRFKIRTPVGGSGMINLRKYFFIVVPNETDHYKFSGVVAVDEYAGLGGGAHDFEVEYQQ